LIFILYIFIVHDVYVFCTACLLVFYCAALVA